MVFGGIEPVPSNTNNMSASGDKSGEGPHPHPIHAASHCGIEVYGVTVVVIEHPFVVVHE